MGRFIWITQRTTSNLLTHPHTHRTDPEDPIYPRKGAYTGTSPSSTTIITIQKKKNSLNACTFRLTLQHKPPSLGTGHCRKQTKRLTSHDHHTRWPSRIRHIGIPSSPRDPRTAGPGYVWASQQPRPPRLRVPALRLLVLKSWFSTPQKSARRLLVHWSIYCAIGSMNLGPQNSLLSSH